jgi:hypothetical protein
MGPDPSRWGNGGQPQHWLVFAKMRGSLADGGMGANRNCLVLALLSRPSLADGGMGANRNLTHRLYHLARSLADGGMGANRNDGCVNRWKLPA